MSNCDAAMYSALNGKRPWALEATETIEHLKSNPDQGLEQKEARNRLKKYGPNRIEAGKQRSVWEIFIAQIKNLIVLLLAVAAVVSFALGQLLEGISILVAMIVNVLIGFGTELRAVRSMEALAKIFNELQPTSFCTKCTKASMRCCGSSLCDENLFAKHGCLVHDNRAGAGNSALFLTAVGGFGMGLIVPLLVKSGANLTKINS